MGGATATRYGNAPNVPYQPWRSVSGDGSTWATALPWNAITGPIANWPTSRIAILGTVCGRALFRPAHAVNAPRSVAGMQAVPQATGDP